MSLLIEISMDFHQYSKINEKNLILSLLKKTRVLLAEPGLQAIVVYRINKKLSKNGSGYLSRFFFLPILFFLTSFIRKAYEIHISNSADIGQGFYIGHFGGIYIGKSKIGNNCVVSNQVKINESVSSSGELGFPVIGNKVWIGAHSVIEGDIIIGDEATVSAGSIVRESIEKKALVTGSPARVVSLNYDNSSLIR